jgi:hypothetical protein
MNGKKLDRPLFLDMPFGEALTRFVHTKPEEVEAATSRKRKSPKHKKRRAADAAGDSLGSEKLD